MARTAAYSQNRKFAEVEILLSEGLESTQTGHWIPNVEWPAFANLRRLLFLPIVGQHTGVAPIFFSDFLDYNMNMLPALAERIDQRFRHFFHDF